MGLRASCGSLQACNSQIPGLFDQKDPYLFIGTNQNEKDSCCVAVLGAFAGSALAADVQIYGIVDTGLGYNHVDVDGLGDGQDVTPSK